MTSKSLGLVAQWIRHRPTEPGIAGSSPAEVIFHWADAIACMNACHRNNLMDTHMKCASWESNPGLKHGRLVCCRYTIGALDVKAGQRRPANLL